MGLRSALRKITHTEDQRPTYNPQPMDERLPDGRSALRLVDDNRPTYAPPSPVPVTPDPADIAQGPVYDPPVGLPSKPATAPETMADRYMASATPMEDTTRERTVTPAPAGPQVTYQMKKGQNVPTGVTGGGDDLEKAEAYDAALRAYNPKNHNSRLKSGLINFGRAYLHGQGLVGATIQGSGGLADPSSDERYANEQAIAKTGRAVAQGQKNRAAVSDLANEEQKRQLEMAQAQKTLQGPVYEPQKIQLEDGSYVWSTPGKSETSPVYAPGARTPLKGKTTGSTKPVLVDRVNKKTGKKEQYLVQDGNADKLVAVEADDGSMVSPGARLTANAMAGDRQHRYGREKQTDAERNADQEQARIDRENAKKKDAGALVGKLEGSRRDAMNAQAKIGEYQRRMAEATNQAERDDAQKSIDEWVTARDKAKADAAEHAKALNTGFSDLYEAGVSDKPEDQGLAYYKIKPFDVKAKWIEYPHASKAQMKAAIQVAKDRGQEIINDK